MTETIQLNRRHFQKYQPALLPLLEAKALGIGDHLVLSKPDYLEIVQPSKASAAVKIQAVPPSEWPLWAKAMALLCNSEDRGLGDTIARVIGPVGGDAFKSWHLKIMGEPCGCAGRQESLNLQYPYSSVGSATWPLDKTGINGPLKLD